MEVILKKDVENLGFKDDLVKVKNGYARNYLIPQGSAILATVSAKKVLAETLKQRAHRDEKLIGDAKKVAKSLEEVSIKIMSKTGDGTKLFGSVNNADVSEALAKQGHDIEKKFISIEGRNIKRTGDYVAHLRLHRELIVDLPFEIYPDPASMPKKKKVKEEVAQDDKPAKEEDSMFGKKQSIDEVLGIVKPKKEEPEVVETAPEQEAAVESTKGEETKEDKE